MSELEPKARVCISDKESDANVLTCLKNDHRMSSYIYEFIYIYIYL